MKKLIVKKSLAGLGLYTKTPLKKGEFVINYTGKMITSKEADEKCGKYLFEINSKWTIDGSGRNNLARYINHSCRPNCEAYIVGKKIKILAKKNIGAGEELSYNYGKEYFDEFIKPFGCRCKKCQNN
ncbi:MAG: SET domain-containing protein-lysine N-methyltransferase [Minisyncoccales bacterium]